MTRAFSAISIKSLNEERRELVGIASTPELDRVKDIVKPLGLSFAPDAPLLLNHDHAQPVGTVQFGKATLKGLPFKATIAKVAEDGVVKDRTDEAWHSVKAGLIKGVSIGFIPRASEPLGPGKGTRFTKADVHELSLVAIPCNPGAFISAFKSLRSEQGTGWDMKDELTVTTRGIEHHFYNTHDAACPNNIAAMVKHLQANRLF